SGLLISHLDFLIQALQFTEFTPKTSVKSTSKKPGLGLISDHWFVDPIMQTHDAIGLLREACALQHMALKTERSYTHWVLRYAAFLKDPKAKSISGTEKKIEAFLTSLALAGVSASTQNQAFNALLFFYRFALKQELGNINSLRAKRPAALRYCPARDETLQL